jgi:hypothetical protein
MLLPVTPRARILSLVALAAALVVPASGLANGPRTESVKLAGVAVSDVRETSARAHGVINPSDETTTWWFEYGQAPDATQSTKPVEVRQRGAIVVTADLAGLDAATTYQVRLVAESAQRRGASPWVTFTTLAAAPPETLPAPEPGTTLPAPELTKSVVVAPIGTIGIREPGSDRFRTLSAADSIPVGSVVDARNGAITLAAAQESGPPQRARFGGGRFLIRQRPDANGYVDLHLRGRQLELCSPRGHTRVLASAARKRPKRKLWGSDRHGRFRTHGRDSVATVRGTRWTMVDRCGGTLTRVTEGAVDVKLRATGRVVRVRAGETHFARHRG